MKTPHLVKAVRHRRTNIARFHCYAVPKIGKLIKAESGERNAGRQGPGAAGRGGGVDREVALNENEVSVVPDE